jgi:glutamate racemase
MVNRKTLFQGIFVEKEAAKEFEDLAEDGETKTQTLQKIMKEYKSKCHCQNDSGVIFAD